MISAALVTLSLLVAQTQPGQVADIRDAFVQEAQTTYAESSGLPSADVRAIVAPADGEALVATAKGLARFEGASWKAAPGPGFDVTRLWRTDRTIWAADDSRLARWDGAQWATLAVPGGARVTGIAGTGGAILVATTKGLLTLDGVSLKPVVGATQPIDALSCAGAAPGLVGLAVSGGKLFGVKGGAGSVFALSPLTVADGSYGWDPISVGAITAEGNSLWFGAKGGAGRFNTAWNLYTGKEGLPYDHFTCAAPGESGVVWFGTERGAIRYDGKNWAYRAGRRWLPDDHVNAIAVDAEGTAWIATPKGVSRIERKKMSLAEKAAWFEKIIDARHTRMGYVVRCSFKETGNLASSWINHTDNDGLYTAMYGAAEAFRYGATKDPDAKKRAKRCFDALKFLVDVTGIPGFPARAVIPSDWPEDPNLKMGAAMNAAEKKSDPLWKDILPRWPKSADGKYLWKCDTSSDEMAGHYFFYGVYYDLVAETPEEKTAIVEQVRAITNHIVDHGFRLVDHDGKPTRWGDWSPEYVNSMNGGWGDRGLQAVEMLSFLNVAHHVTGDQKFADASKFLRDKYVYHINAIYGRRVFPPDFVVPWDDNLAFLSYYGLLKYEKDPELLKAYRMSLDSNWLFISRKNDPFYNFVYSAVLPDKDKPVAENDVYADFPKILGKGVDTLRRTPLLLLGWEMKNSHRLDIELDRTPRQRAAYGWSAVTGEALPIEERCQIRINSDHFDLDKSMGDIEYEGTFYLLPYYLGLYHGFLK